MTEPLTFTEAEEAEMGAQLAEFLHLRKDHEHPDRWRTAWGTKTNLGLFRTLRHTFQLIEKNDRTMLK